MPTKFKFSRILPVDLRLQKMRGPTEGQTQLYLCRQVLIKN
eukprot:SAG31_NODE_1051_length_10157_cov_203.009048_1_plen_41_part_00